MTVIIYNESLLGAGTPVFTLVPDTLYHLLPLEKLCTNPKYSVVTKIPEYRLVMKTLTTHFVAPCLYKILTDHPMPFIMKNYSVIFMKS